MCCPSLRAALCDLAHSCENFDCVCVSSVHQPIGRVVDKIENEWSGCVVMVEVVIFVIAEVYSEWQRQCALCSVGRVVGIEKGRSKFLFFPMAWLCSSPSSDYGLAPLNPGKNCHEAYPELHGLKHIPIANSVTAEK